MAEYGLLCSKLRVEGLGCVADVIEKLQGERDALKAENRKLQDVRAVLIDMISAGDVLCSKCANLANQHVEHCELDEHHCSQCSQDECVCKDCDSGEHWDYNGAGAETSAEPEPDDPRIEQFLRDSYK